MRGGDHGRQIVSRIEAIFEFGEVRYERGELMHRVTLGEIVEHALAALERELTRTERARRTATRGTGEVWG